MLTIEFTLSYSGFQGNPSRCNMHAPPPGDDIPKEFFELELDRLNVFVCFRDIDDRCTDHVPLRFHHISLRAFAIQLEAFSLQVSKDGFCSFLEEGFTYL